MQFILEVNLSHSQKTARSYPSKKSRHSQKFHSQKSQDIPKKRQDIPKKQQFSKVVIPKNKWRHAPKKSRYTLWSLVIWTRNKTIIPSSSCGSLNVIIKKKKCHLSHNQGISVYWKCTEKTIRSIIQYLMLNLIRKNK